LLAGKVVFRNIRKAKPFLGVPKTGTYANIINILCSLTHTRQGVLWCGPNVMKFFD